MSWLVQGMALPLVCTSRSNLYIRGAHLWHQHHGEDTARLAPQQEGDRADGHCPDWEEQLEGQAQDKAPKICRHSVCTPSFPWDEQISHETSRLLLCKGSFRASGSFGVNPRSSKVSTALGLPIPTQPRQEVSMTCLAGGFQPRSHTNPRLPPVAPQASPDPAPWQGQVWIPAGMGQHQARWESSPNSRTRTTGKERARAGGGQMRKDPQPFGNTGPKYPSIPANSSWGWRGEGASAGSARKSPSCNFLPQSSFPRKRLRAPAPTGPPRPSPGAGVRVLAKPAKHLQQVGTQSRERDGPAQWSCGGMNIPGLHSSTWEGPWNDVLGELGQPICTRGGFMEGEWLGSIN